MGLTEDIASIKDFMAKSKAEEVEKKFKFPWGKKVGKKQKTKNFVTVLVVNENGNYYFKKYQIDDQTILHEAIPRLATAGHCMFDKKGNPLIILPNWSVEPFSPLEHYKTTLINGSNTTGFKILMSKMQSSKLDEKKKIGNWLYWILGIALVGVIAYAFISGGGK